MKPTIEHVSGVLEHRPAVERVGVAFSGGLDSTVLLHLAEAACRSLGRSLTAVHVHHGLQSDADDWADHCRRIAGGIGVECEIYRASGQPAGGESLEAWARNVRYGVFREWLRSGGVMLLAHHADDQLETVLLQLLRGAGVAGLGGMPACAPLAAGEILRPLLSSTRNEIEALGREWSLDWIEDPSNRDTDRDRNFLRHEIVPRLCERWPAAAETASRSARHAGEAAELTDVLAEEDLAVLDTGRRGRIRMPRRGDFSDARLRNLLRRWVRSQGYRPPPEARLIQGLRDLFGAGADRHPRLEWDGAVIRRYRDCLYIGCELPPPPSEELELTPEEPLDLPAGLGRLALVREARGGLDPAIVSRGVRVRFRRDGDVIRNTAGRRSLAKLFQEQGVVPWMRDRVPLLVSDGEIVAVGDFWHPPGHETDDGGAGWRVVWSDHPPFT